MATITFKKPKRNFRRKVADSDSEEETHNADNGNTEAQDLADDNDVMIVKPEIFKKSKKKKKEPISGISIYTSTTTAPSLLSFDEDADEGEVFKIKKSSHSKRLSKQLKKESEKYKDASPKAEEEKPPTERIPSPPSDTEEKIKRLREEFRTLNGDEAADFEDSEEEGEGGRAFKALLARGEIPDANTIHIIRKKRQLAREMGDYIPVSEPVKPESTKSRLIREEDHDKSDDEDERMDFTVNQQAIERQRMRDEFLAAEHGSDREDSDQEREWEEQQIKKAKAISVQLPTDEESPQMNYGNMDTGNLFDNGYIDGDFDRNSKQNQTFQPFTKMTDCSQITLESVRKRLQERLDAMNEVHRAHVLERDTLVNNIDGTESSITTCEDSSSGLEEKYAFFQQTRGYVRDLIECLSEKVPKLNELETRMLNLLKNRSAKYQHRRQQDLQDQSQAFSTSKSQVIMAADENEARQRRIAEREARRSRRRRAREQKAITGHSEGLSSDDELNHYEISKFNNDKEQILSEARDLFDDVTDDFNDIEMVKERFEDWKHEYQETYEEAYIGLCLPKIINPFIRLQLLGWNPLDEYGRDFEESSWYESLAFYCYRYKRDIDGEDEDLKLLPSILEKILVPKLTSNIENVWDPMSTTQTARLVNMLHKWIRDYPTLNADSKYTKLLVKAVIMKIRRSLDNDVFMPMYPKSVLENKSSGATVFFHRQSWTCIKLLGNILSWHGILSVKVLQELALDSLLNRYVVLGLMNSVINTDVIHKCQVIVSTFPKQWFTSLDGDRTIPQLENLCRFFLHAAENLNKLPDRKEARDHIKQISKMFINIHAMDHALNLATQYSFKIS